MFVCLTPSLCTVLCFAENDQISVPTHFPNIAFQNSLTAGQQLYLGLDKKSPFSLNDIKSPLILVELTNTYCVSCKKNIKIFNEVFKKTQSDKKLKENFKVIGIAIGNNKIEVNHFKNENKILYPIIIDPEFTVHKALGEPRVPYTIFIKRDSKGKHIVVNTHRGKYDSADEVMNEIKNCLYCDTNISPCIKKGIDSDIYN